MLIFCDRCEFPFDAMDDRAWVPMDDVSSGPLCPLCTVRVLRSTEAWCVWNDCQGIFEDTVRSRRSAAAELLKSSHADIGDKVVPVRVFAEPEDEAWRREWSERRYHENTSI